MSKPLKDMKILSLGMPRTALTILGYDGVHHGIQSISLPHKQALMSKAANSMFLSLSTYTGIPFPRNDWDALFGNYEAVTDMGSLFALQLIKAYPHAKVILVERDVDTWFESVNEACFDRLWGGKTLRTVLLGFFDAHNVDGIRKVAKERYVRHYGEIRAAVPKERLLEFRLEQSWEPLCAFLGHDEPEGVNFPVESNRSEHVPRVKSKENRFHRLAPFAGIKKSIPWPIHGVVSNCTRRIQNPVP
ncbi:hypothetical protein EDB82DRAFT_564097 [Fusarium venenatum]|uniref:uncharacterized protein n=1 Tax=Fusarium venenatum TaxID=56646 RepID=UPI001D53BD69|nr:hypothetical protein EDB82DRAFT_564097 [Fusarium venenatum]